MNEYDEKLEALVCIRDAMTQLQTAVHVLGEAIRREQKAFHEIMQAVREVRKNPCAVPCAQHDFAPPPVAHICHDDEPPPKDP